MIIGVDGNEANVENKVGVSVYTSNLLAYFQSHATESVQFIVYLRELPQRDLPKETVFFKYKIVWGPVLWSQLFLPLYLWKLKFFGQKLDVFFSPAHYIPRFCPFKTVVTIHDVSYLYFPEEFLKKDLYQLTKWTQYAIQRSEKIIAVSKTTKKDLMREYAIPENKIQVIYNGYENSKSLTTNYHLPTTSSPYFLYVGTIQPRKNISLLIKSFAQFHKNHPTFKLIIAGKKGWLYEKIFQEAAQYECKDSILFLGFVSDKEKAQLYKNAVAFILPSLYEGFGIPLLEAMSYNCPVLSSFSSSLPEIGGEACLYFDPKNSSDLVEKMEIITTQKDTRTTLITAGKKRIKIFSWNVTGEKTLQALIMTTK
jgi:glycosyltransferase involved in cell wall biosynthesis